MCSSDLLEHVRKTRKMEDAPAKPAGCPSAAILRMAPAPLAAAPGETGSSLSHWPIKIRLVPPHAPFLDNADLIIAGDCCPAASPDFHSRFLDGRVLMLGCPKFDNAKEYVERLGAWTGPPVTRPVHRPGRPPPGPLGRSD